MSRIKFAVTGCGHIGKRHAEMIERNSEAELVALIDVKEKSALNIQQFEVPFFKTLDAFLQSGIQVDVINIATPNGLHAQQAFQCLDAGHHVVIEKPVTLTKADAQKIIDKASAIDKFVFAVKQNRYSPPSAWLKELIENQKLGTIFLIQLNCWWNRDERYYLKDDWHGTKDMDGGTLFTQFSHFIDMLYWIFGDIKNIQAKLKSFNHGHLTSFEDSGLVTFDLVNGGMGCINFSTSVWDKNLESSITVIGQNGSIKIGGQYMEKVDYCHIKDYELPPINITNAGNDYGAYKGSAANHNYVIQNVIDVIKKRSPITTNAKAGMMVADIIERIYLAGKLSE